MVRVWWGKSNWEDFRTSDTAGSISRIRACRPDARGPLLRMRDHRSPRKCRRLGNSGALVSPLCGGQNTTENIVAACCRCNQSRAGERLGGQAIGQTEEAKGSTEVTTQFLDPRHHRTETIGTLSSHKRAPQPSSRNGSGDRFRVLLRRPRLVLRPPRQVAVRSRDAARGARQSSAGDVGIALRPGRGTGSGALHGPFWLWPNNGTCGIHRIL